MAYMRAEEILPPELLAQVQKYVSGAMLYVPCRGEHRCAWGAVSGARADLRRRNAAIRAEYRAGWSVAALAGRHYLSEKSIQRILRANASSESIDGKEDDR